MCFMTQEMLTVRGFTSLHMRERRTPTGTDRGDATGTGTESAQLGGGRYLGGGQR